MSPRRPRPKKPRKPIAPIPGDPTDPEGFCVTGADWVEWLGVHNYAENTLRTYSTNLTTFVTWAEVRGLRSPKDVTLPVLETYQRHVSLYRKPNGMPLAWSTQCDRLVPLKVFFSWCTRSRRILYNPAADLVLPKQNHSLPKATLTHQEAEAVLSIPDTTTALGMRDRVILELLYATGLRRGELGRLHLLDVDLVRNWLTLRTTKTRFDRVVPMGERAGAWVTRYVADFRPQLLVGADPGFVILAANGEGMGLPAISALVTHYIAAAGVGKSGSCHLFRHTAATLMLEGGADIRYVQELLGHRDLNSTQIYTRVVPERLASIHRATHPGASLPPTATCAAGRHEDCPAASGNEVFCGCPCHDTEPVPVVVR